MQGPREVKEPTEIEKGPVGYLLGFYNSWSAEGARETAEEAKRIKHKTEEESKV